jgi:hypothetical protein
MFSSTLSSFRIALDKMEIFQTSKLNIIDFIGSLNFGEVAVKSEGTRFIGKGSAMIMVAHKEVVRRPIDSASYQLLGTTVISARDAVPSRLPQTLSMSVTH